MPASPRAGLASAGYYGLLLAVAAGTVVAAAVGTANPLVAVAPVLLAAGAYAMTRVPLRWSASALILLLLIPDLSDETKRQWRTPMARLGDLVNLKLDAVAGIPGAAVTGMEVIAAFLFVVWLRRRATGSRMDAAGQVRPASVLRELLVLYVAAVLVAEAIGLARGFPLAPWKLRFLLHPPLLVGLFLIAFRGPRDHLLIGRIVVVAACVRSVMAFAVQRIATAETGGRYSYATSHGDSVLFSVAIFLLIVDFLERLDRPRLIRVVLIVPILLMGGIENQRRTFWVMLLLMMVAVYFLTPRNAWKLSLTRLAVLAAPLVVLYVGVGWYRSEQIFAPVKSLRTVMEPSRDRSAYWRDVENWNVAMSMRQMPLTGLGLGGRYTEVMRNDDVSFFYKEYRDWPHNTFLGLLLLMGPFGFTAVSALGALAIFLSIRSYRMATTPDHRVAALGCLCAVIACQVMAWGDLGASFPQYKVFSALAVVLSAKLAVVTGAWPARAPRAAASAARAGEGALSPTP
jgi:O-antigen ligase